MTSFMSYDSDMQMKKTKMLNNPMLEFLFGK